MTQDRKPPRRTELDTGQTLSLLAAVAVCVGGTVVGALWVKIICLVLFVLILVGLASRVWRDRTGRY